MKRILALVLALLMIVPFVACGGSKNESEETKDDKTDTIPTPLADELKAKMEEEEKNGTIGTATEAWNLYIWLTSQLEDFHNPASIEFVDGASAYAGYKDGGSSGEVEFYMVKLRGETPAGGMYSAYFQLTPTSIVQTDWEFVPITGNDVDGHRVWVTLHYSAKAAFEEYMAIHYPNN